MKLAWLTDIHLNFLTGQAQAQFLESIRDQADSFVITGDIADSESICRTLRLIDKVINKPVYFVLGNHDFYRGSLAGTRVDVKAVVAKSKNLVYLSDSGPIELSPSISLVGHDGWADANFGDYFGTHVLLNDFMLIRDFQGLNKVDAREVMLGQAEMAAKHIDDNTPNGEVIVATHVPPFKETTWHEGNQTSDDFLPFFASKTMGDMLATKPNKMTVLCGHCHSGGEVKISETLSVLTGDASYGNPKIQRIFTC